ncbi:hypothetical protein [Bartonella tribocorum]|nr:hypothetical protein [Bartonella tribocorum]
MKKIVIVSKHADVLNLKRHNKLIGIDITVITMSNTMVNSSI